MHRYPEDRDDLARQGSSHLSAHLHFGSLSAAETRHAVGAHAGQLVRQLAWRDFYLRVLAARPDAAWRDYRDRGDRWRHAPADLLAWQRGRTGYPVVDAAMRQLTTEGWLPNRARLLAASFLCKTLYLDWRPGAAFFLHHLVDGDLASNQLNWQWVAGTGTDTRPGRVLDPVWHGEQHDPDGAYVHRYVPELRSVPGPLVHRPWELDASVRSGLDYPGPVVGLEEGYARFVSARRKHKQGKQRNRRR
ncbi:FAD-binding domain-containing protein [Lentzea chajnantorensis]